MQKGDKLGKPRIQRRDSNESGFFVANQQNSIRSRSKNHLIEKTSQTTNTSVNNIALTKVNSRTEFPELVAKRDKEAVALRRN
jgi:hypothetical protein